MVVLKQSTYALKKTWKSILSLCIDGMIANKCDISNLFWLRQTSSFKMQSILDIKMFLIL